MTHRLSLVAALLTLLLGPAVAQTPTFRGETSVVAVEISVQVLAGGKPVRGLGRENFEVTHHGKKIRITDFDVVDLAALEPRLGSAVATIPQSGRRHFLMLFDLSFSDPQRVMRARQAAKDVLDKLHPSDAVAVAIYGGSSGDGARLVLGFSLDRRQVAFAIDTLGFADDAVLPTDPLGLASADLPGSLASSSPPTIRAGLESDLEADLDRLVQGVARRGMTAEVQVFTKAMAELAGWIRPVQGRKQVIFFSQGFDSSLVMGVGGASAGERRLLRDQAQSIADGQYWKVDTNLRHGDGTSLNDLSTALQEFVKADATIQSVDITGLPETGGVGGASGTASAPASTGPNPGIGGLFMMADDTGGELYENYNDLGEAMGDLLVRTGVTYVLTIQPEVPLDGEYHPLKVRLKGGPKRARVLHRPGYFAPRPYSELTIGERSASAASLVMGGADGGSIDCSVLTLPSTVATDPGRVAVLIEIDGPSVVASATGRQIPLEVFAYAIGSDGTVHDFFAQTLNLDLEKLGERLGAGGLKVWGHFDLAAGQYLSRVLVRNGLTGKVGLETDLFDVAAPGTSHLLPPLVPDPAGQWILARLDQATATSGSEPPFTLFGREFVPSARPQLVSGESIDLRLAGVGLGDLVAADGVLRRDGEVVGGTMTAARMIVLPSGDKELVATFDPGPVTAGRYTLEVSVSNAAGEELSSSIPVIVTVPTHSAEPTSAPMSPTMS